MGHAEENERGGGGGDESGRFLTRFVRSWVTLDNEGNVREAVYLIFYVTTDAKNNYKFDIMNRYMHNLFSLRKQTFIVILRQS